MTKGAAVLQTLTSSPWMRSYLMVRTFQFCIKMQIFINYSSLCIQYLNFAICAWTARSRNESVESKSEAPRSLLPLFTARLSRGYGWECGCRKTGYLLRLLWRRPRQRSERASGWGRPVHRLPRTPDTSEPQVLHVRHKRDQRQHHRRVRPSLLGPQIRLPGPRVQYQRPQTLLRRDRPLPIQE